MARKIDIVAPEAPGGQAALTVNRWLKTISDPVYLNEPILELTGNGVIVYVHAPEDGILSSMAVRQNQNVLSGMVLGQVSVLAKDSIEWENFDQVTELIEEFAIKAQNMKQSRDANEALGQLLGVTDEPVFQTKSIEEQNKFLQKVVDEHQKGNLTPAAVTQKLLEGLYLRMPANAPAGPRGPALGPAGPGMGGGGGVGYTGITPQQQQGYAPPQKALPEQTAPRSLPGGGTIDHESDG